MSSGESGRSTAPEGLPRVLGLWLPAPAPLPEHEQPVGYRSNRPGHSELDIPVRLRLVGRGTRRRAQLALGQPCCRLALPNRSLSAGLGTSRLMSAAWISFLPATL
jgi:hypothetical protein